MARLTIVFGVVLAAVALGAYLIEGAGRTAMLHPAGIGVLLIVCGALAMTNDMKRRALWMHIAVVIGLLGVGFGAKGAVQVFQLAHGAELPHPIGVEERAVVCLVSLIFVGFCIRNFVENRRARLAEL